MEHEDNILSFPGNGERPPPSSPLKEEALPPREAHQHLFRLQVLLDLERERLLMYRVGLVLSVLGGLLMLRELWIN